MEIVKLIGGDVLPDDQKLTLEIARVIRLGFLQQNAFHKDDTCVSMEKQYKMMEVILYLYQKEQRISSKRNADECVKSRRNLLRKSLRSNMMFQMIICNYWIFITNRLMIFMTQYWKRMHKEAVILWELNI